MNILNRKFTLSITTFPIIGLAIGRTSYKKVDSTRKAIKTTTFLLHIICFSIELSSKKLIARQENEFIPKKKTKKKTFIAKLIAMITLFCGLMAGTALYEAARPSTDIYGASALIMVSVLFTTLFIVLGISYLSMDPNEKYKYV